MSAVNALSSQALSKKALDQYSHGRIPAALATANQALSIDPDNPEILHIVGLLTRETGDETEALRLLTRSAQIAPELPHLHDAVGVTYAKRKQFDEAIAHFRRAIVADSTYSSAHYNMGNAHLGKREFTLAADAFLETLRLDKKAWEAWGNLGITLRCLGHLEDALECFDNALKINPDDFGARFNQAQVLLKLNRFEEAVDAYRSLLIDAPNRADIYNDLGSAFMGLGDMDEAIQSFKKATEIKPDFSSALANLGTAMSYQGYIQGPIQHFIKALEHDPQNLSIHCKLGHVLMDFGHLSEAEKCFELVHRNDPTREDALIGLAACSEKQGDYQTALTLIQPMLTDQRTSTNLGVLFARAQRRAKSPEKGIPLLRTMITQERSIPESVLLNYTLGDNLDAMGEYEAAFNAFKMANDLRDEVYDGPEHSKEVDQIISAFPAESFGKRKKSTAPTGQQLLIVGFPRSGTSLVEQIIASHPKGHGSGEREELRLLTVSLAQHFKHTHHWAQCFDKASQERIDLSTEWYQERVNREAGDALQIVDKMPANYMYLGAAAQILPQARIIHCVRSPLDTCLSCYFKNFRSSYAFANKLNWLGHRYREYKRLMAHWSRALPLPILEVDYQEMVSDPERMIRRIISFTGLEWDDNVMQFHNTKRVVNTASYDQVRKPIYSTSVNRSDSYRPMLQPLVDALEEPR